MKRILAGLASLAVILTLVVGIPAALILLAGNPIPSIAELSNWLTLPDWGGSFLIGSLIPCVAWIAWAVFVIPFLTSFPEVLRSARLADVGSTRMVVGERGPFKLQRKTAGFLLGAVIVMFGGGQAAMATPMESMASPAAVVQSIDSQIEPIVFDEVPVNQEVTPPPAPAPTMESVAVDPGDSLWKIAEEELGDGNRFGEIFEASKDVVQPDGALMQDPNIIQPGWNLNVPGAPAVTTEVVPAPEVSPPAPVEEESAPTEHDAASAVTPDSPTAEAGTVDDDSAPQETASNAPESESEGKGSPELSEPQQGAAVPAPGGVASTVTTAGTDTAEEEQAEEMPAVLAAGGIAGLLGAALLGGLGVRRMRQRRVRRRDERIAMPDPEAALIEAQLREVQDPLEMVDVDRVCRFLTEWSRDAGERLPELLAIRLAPEERQISVFLMAPADLPAPFVAVSTDHTAWQIRDTDLEGLGESHQAGAYPALVTLGKDQAGGHVLIDLEQWGDIAIVGERDLATAAATAAVLELAHVSWADETLIHLVGDSIVIPETLGNGRCERHPDLGTLIDRLRHRAINVRASLDASEHTSIGRARAADSGESWTPEVVVVSDASTVEMAELKALAAERPRLGIISLSVGGAGAAELTIKSDTEAVFVPAGLSYIPQLVTAETLSRLESVFAVTEVAPVVEEVSPVLDVDEATEVAADAPHEFDAETPDSNELSAGTADASSDTEVSVEDSSLEEIPAAVDEVAHDAPATPEREVVVLPERDLHAPYVRVLGKVEIQSGVGRELGNPALARSRELVAFLALHPNATTEEYVRAFWPNKTAQQASASMRKLSNMTRNWLGDAQDGGHYLPRYNPTDGYRVHETIRSDWGDFQMLVGDDPMGAATANLIEALKLVRDQPFTGVRDRNYTWAALDKERMIALIADAADELYTRARDAEDSVKASYAATLGKRVAPESELAWRNSLRVALSQGNPDEFERLVNELIDYLDELGDDFEPDLETRVLVEEGRAVLASV